VEWLGAERLGADGLLGPQLEGQAATVVGPGARDAPAGAVEVEVGGNPESRCGCRGALGRGTGHAAADGTDGADGADGTDGTDGADGADEHASDEQDEHAGHDADEHEEEDR
jgi:hypothetical protein